MAITTLFLTDVEISARMYRGVLSDLFTEGVKDVQGGQFKVTPRALGANMTVTVAAGVAFIQGDTYAGQGLYRVDSDTVIEDVAIPAAPATGTRTDLVVLETVDKQALGTGTTNASRVRVLSGQSALTVTDKTMIPLARVAVAAGQASIQAQHITDVRFQTDKAQLAFAATDVQWFTTSATWTKVYGAKAVEFIGIGGGESGQRGGAADGGNSPSGGRGGHGGERVRALIPAASLGATEPVVVGAGGAPVPGTQVVGATPSGNPGGSTSFAGVIARGGNVAIPPLSAGLGGVPATWTGSAEPGGASNGGGAGGGGGRGRATNNGTTPGGGLGGINNETGGAAPRTNTTVGGSGGSGGGVGSSGGAGELPGGGGGGGGANYYVPDSSIPLSGAGGKGGDGLAVIITYT